jgi:hypothetical protein
MPYAQLVSQLLHNLLAACLLSSIMLSGWSGWLCGTVDVGGQRTGGYKLQKHMPLIDVHVEHPCVSPKPFVQGPETQGVAHNTGLQQV